MKFYLVRHGETEWNRAEKLQGHSDIELNDLGRAQAANLREFARSLPIDRVVSSDLKRAAETAKIGFPDHQPIPSDPRLREVHLGIAEGMSRHHLEDSFGKQMVQAWFSTEAKDMEASFPNGETRAVALKRMQAAIKDWRDQFPGKTLAFVTHGLVMRTVAQTCMGYYRPEFRAPNCAIFEFVVSEERIRLGQIYITNEAKAAEDTPEK